MCVLHYKPGDRVATDQIISSQPGLVSQEKGTKRRARIWGAAVFVDCASNLVKVQLMLDAPGEFTLEAKNAFEQDCMTRGVLTKQYHADIDRYATNKSKLQSLTFCGLGDHQQNGITESKIKHLTLSGRILLLHTQHHLPEYITTMRWRFVLLAAVDCMNNLHIDIEGNSPETTFLKVSGWTTRVGNFHIFGCTVYVLDSKL
jgi:hypothetical protein